MNYIVAVFSISAGLAGIWQIANLSSRSGMDAKIIATLSLSNFVYAFLTTDISDKIKAIIMFTIVTANVICSWKIYNGQIVKKNKIIN